MHVFALFIRRPVATALLTLALALSGLAAFFSIPVAPLPQVTFPSIMVQAQLPGASPDTMARTVATPLEQPLSRLPGLNGITSSSTPGNSRIVLEFNLNRDINGAAREVQAALNAVRQDLPTTLRSPPQYRKMNPGDSPIMVLAMTSPTRTPGQIYEAVGSIVSQRLAQVPGVGDVELGGSSQPALRVEIDPAALNARQLSSDEVRAAIQAALAQRPLGLLSNTDQRWSLDTHERGDNAPVLEATATHLPSLIVAWREGAPVRLREIARVDTAVENTRTRGLFNGQPAVVALVTRQPTANIIETVDALRDILPSVQAQLPQDIRIQVASDRTGTIRRALHEVGFTLCISIVLVITVVGVFLGSWRATLIPAIAVVSSLLASVAVMHVMGYSLNNLSLMALTIATGFVVDDAIVVVENIARHLAHLQRTAPSTRPALHPTPPTSLALQAALLGAKEVGFTVLSITLSLVAVFLPLMFWDGIVGRFLREFALTLSAAVLVSLVISLTTTPMLCATLLRERVAQAPVRPRSRMALALHRGGQWVWQALQRHYAQALDWSLTHRIQVLLLLAVLIGLNIFLFIRVPKGFLPEQDSGQIVGGLTTDRSLSSTVVNGKFQAVVDLIRADPAVDTVVGYVGGGRGGGGFLFVNLKPRHLRDVGAIAVAARLRPQLTHLSGVQVFLNPTQEFRSSSGNSASNRGSIQYELRSSDLKTLKTWTFKLMEALKTDPRVSDVNTDWEENTLAQRIHIDRDTASRLGVSTRDVDQALYNAFGQRPVATIYADTAAYNIVLEWAPEHQPDPQALAHLHIPARFANASPPLKAANPGRKDTSSSPAISTEPQRLIALSTIASIELDSVPTTITHTDGELSANITFNLPPGGSMSAATQAVADAENRISMPTQQIRGNLAGMAKHYQSTQSEQWWVILATLATIYIVLGVLYESLIHPLTVLSTLPSAGVGALIALLIMDMDLSIISLIGLLLLIGIVKKNAILIIDFAIEAQRHRGLNAAQAVREACLIRLRPILMTTLAATLGALPLAIGFGEGAELRQPLGVSVIGGLMLSQILTLLTTPVVYVVLDRWRNTPASDHRRQILASLANNTSAKT